MMSKFELQQKRDGHTRAVNLVARKARFDGKGSKAHDLYLHHLGRALHYAGLIKATGSG